ncbi:MAG TPA: RNA 2',3'-cyclic phosphodiesterase [Solirubrobacteraceae bacterium]|nr:RNA 2',3'-cyclic phosphodiesterase [Solirubrobacteraceae bacterium]
MSLDHAPVGTAEDGDGRARLFVALELPGGTRDAVGRWQARALQGLDGVRAIARDDLHATMCFLGWRSEHEIGAIADACGVLAAYTAPDLRVAAGTWLPPRRPRVLAVELEDPSGALARAQAALADTLEAGGWYRRENRPYLAHVTVARLGRGSRLPRRPLPDAPEVGFRATQVTLYRSRLLRSGARYEPLASVELMG